LRRTSALIRHVMGQQLILWLSVENFMVFIFPLFARVLSTLARVTSTSEVSWTDGDQVHVPDTDEEVFEFKILLK